MSTNAQRGGFCLCTLLVLSACGGSAPELVPIESTLTIPVEPAMVSWVRYGTNKSFSLSGWINNSTPDAPVPNTPITGSGTLTIGPAYNVVLMRGPLSGTYALESLEFVSGTQTQGGQSSALSSTATVDYSMSNYTILASYDGTSWSYYAAYDYPATVQAGDTGTLGSASTGGASPTTTTSVYSVASDSPTSLLWTVTNTASGTNTVTTQTVYRITAAGSITLLSQTVSLAVLGTTYEYLVFTYS